MKMKSELLKCLSRAISAGIPVDFNGREIPTHNIEVYIKSGFCTGLCIWVEGYQFNTHCEGIHDNRDYQLAHPELY
jgi:hypothetical protein